MQCEFCGGRAEELARTRAHSWLGCRDCHRTWKEQAPNGTPPGEPAPAPQPAASESARVARGVVLALAAVGVAFAIRQVLTPAIGDASPFIIFTPAVMVSAFYGGAASGGLATALSAYFGSHFFLQALGDPAIERWDRVALFLLVGALLTTMSVVVRSARGRLDESLWREQKARAEAEAASHAKDEFLALVSHELRTPASIVLGWAAAIRSGRLSGDAFGRALEAIERNARVQSKLVEDVLDTSRIMSGRLRFDPERLNLAALVSAAVEQMRPSVEGHRLHLDLDRLHDDWPVVADPVRLQQVFTNLLSNAVKFTPPGGRISVAMTRTETRASVVVSDTGVGIRRDFLPRVFERFEQDPKTLALSKQGLGLGLSICRHFVQQHGGTITADSDGPGTGASFTVTLPLDRRTPRSDAVTPLGEEAGVPTAVP